MTPQHALRKLEALTRELPADDVAAADEYLKVLWDFVLLGKAA